MVPRADLPAAVVLNSVGFNLTRSVGPAIGGLIVATAGAAAAFAVNSLSYFGLIGVLSAWRPTIPASSPAARAARRRRWGRACATSRCRPTSSRCVLRSLPLRPDRGRGAGAPAAGRAPPGAGRAAGLRRAARRLRRRRDRRRLHRRPAARACCRASGIARARLRRLRRLRARCSALSPQPWLTARRDAAAAAPAGCWRWRSSTPRSSSRPRAGWSAGRSRSIRPRPSAAWRSAAGSGAASPRRYGPAQALLIAAARDARRGRRRAAAAAAGRADLDLDPLNRWTEPQVGVDLKPRSGPISITDRVPDRRAGHPRVPRDHGRAPAHPAAATARGTGR